MTHTVIGVFESFDRANHAADRLVASGVKRTQLDVHSQDANFVVSDMSSSPVQEPARAEDRGFMQKVEDFFSNLFGDGERPAEVSQYQEAVRRGSALVTVSNVDEADVSMVRNELEAAGAIDIEKQTSESQGDDRDRVDANANPSFLGEGASVQDTVAADDETAARPSIATGTTRVYSTVGKGTQNDAAAETDEKVLGERAKIDRL